MRRILVMAATFAVMLVGPAIGDVGAAGSASSMLDADRCVELGERRCPTWAHAMEYPGDLVSAFTADLALTGDGQTAFVAGYGRDGDNPYESTATGLVTAVDVASGEVLWERQLQPGPYVTLASVATGGAATSAATDVVVVTGTVGEGFGAATSSMLVAALDPVTGEVLWEHLVEASSGENVGRDIVVAPAQPPGSGAGRPYDATIVVSGWLDGDEDRDAYTLAYTLEGKQLWDARYEGAGDHIPWAAAVAGDRVIVAARSDGTDSRFDTDYLAIAYSLRAGPQGRQVWEYRYDGSGAGAQDAPRALAVSPDGDAVAVAGYSNAVTEGPPFAVDYDATVVLLDTADGSERWVTRWRSDDGTLPEPRDVVVTDERVAIALGIPDPEAPGTDFGTVAFDVASGEHAWTAIESAPRADGEIARALAASEDGSTIVTVGQRSSSDSALVYGGMAQDGWQFTTAYDATDGTRKWFDQHRHSTINNDRGWDVEIAPNGTVVTAARLTRNVDTDDEFHTIGMLGYR